MAKLFARGRKPTAGVTIIELLIAISVIGILAALALPSYLNQRDKAWRAETIATLSGLRTALLLYRVEHDRFPPDELHNVQPIGTEGYWRDARENPWGAPLDYDRGSDGRGLCLVVVSSFGRNRVRNTPPHRRTLPAERGDDIVIEVAAWECDRPPGSDKS